MINIQLLDEITMYNKMPNNLVVHCLSSEYLSGNSRKNDKRYLEDTELIFVVKGSIFVQREEEQYFLSPNDYVLLPPYGQSAVLYEISEETAYYRVSFYVNDLARLNISSVFGACPQSIELTLLLNKLIKISPDDRKYMADLYTALILNEIGSLQRKDSEKNLLAKQIADWIKSNANTDMTVLNVADHFGYNKDYLCRIFKQYHGVGLKKYIDSEIMKRAKSLLLTSSYSMTRISEILLFENANLFNKFFKYHEKMSPAKFRQDYHDHYNATGTNK